MTPEYYIFENKNGEVVEYFEVYSKHLYRHRKIPKEETQYMGFSYKYQLRDYIKDPPRRFRKVTKEELFISLV